jgi:hypothetical protein
MDNKDERFFGVQKSSLQNAALLKFLYSSLTIDFK